MANPHGLIKSVRHIDGQFADPYNQNAAGNGCKQGEQYAMVEPAGRKEGR